MLSVIFNILVILKFLGPKILGNYFFRKWANFRNLGIFRTRWEPYDNNCSVNSDDSMVLPRKRNYLQHLVMTPSADLDHPCPFLEIYLFRIYNPAPFSMVNLAMNGNMTKIFWIHHKFLIHKYNTIIIKSTLSAQPFLCKFQHSFT